MTISKQWLKNNHEEIMRFLVGEYQGNRIPANYASKVTQLNAYFGDRLEGQVIRQLDLHGLVQRECPIVLHVRFDQYDGRELKEWCEANLAHLHVVKTNSFAYNKGYCHKVQFKNGKDALLFKLTYETI